MKNVIVFCALLGVASLMPVDTIFQMVGAFLLAGVVPGTSIQLPWYMMFGLAVLTLASVAFIWTYGFTRKEIAAPAKKMAHVASKRATKAMKTNKKMKKVQKKVTSVQSTLQKTNLHRRRVLVQHIK